MFFRSSLSTTLLLLSIAACTPDAPGINTITLQATKTQLAPGESVQLSLLIDGNLRPNSPTDGHARFSIISGQESGALTVTQGPQTTFIASRGVTSKAAVTIEAISEFDPNKKASLTLTIDPAASTPIPDSNPPPADAGTPDAGSTPIDEPDAGATDPGPIDAGVPAVVTKVVLQAARDVVETDGAIDVTATVEGTGDFSKALTWRVVQGLGTLTETETLKATYRATNVPSKTTIDIEATSVSHPTVIGTLSLKVLSKPTIKGFTVKALRDENGKAIPEGKGLPIGGGTVQLSWSTSDAATVEVSPSLGTVQGDGVETKVTGTTVFTLTVRNAVGSASQDVKVVSENQGLADEVVSFNPNEKGGVASTGVNHRPSATAVDAEGNLYIAGTVQPDQKVFEQDVLVSKYMKNGSLVWTKMIGARTGTANTLTVSGIAVSSTGVFVVCGREDEFASGGSGSTDVLLAKVALDGVGDVKQNYLSTVDSEITYGLAVDKQGDVFVAGATFGNFATPTVSLDSYSQPFVAKFSGSGAGLLWVKQLDSKANARAVAVATNDQGDVYAGVVVSGSFEATEAFGQDDAMVVKFKGSSGETLGGGRIGTSAIDYVSAVAVDSSGRVFLSGFSRGSFQKPQVTQNANDAEFDAWVALYDPDAKRFVWVSQFGSAAREDTAQLAVSPDGAVYVAGTTQGDLLGTGRLAEGDDAWVAKLNAQSGALLWKNQLAGTDIEGVASLHLDSKGYLRVAGTGVKAVSDRITNIWSTLIR